MLYWTTGTLVADEKNLAEKELKKTKDAVENPSKAIKESLKEEDQFKKAILADTKNQKEEIEEYRKELKKPNDTEDVE